MGHFVPGVANGVGDGRRPPGAQGVVAPGAGDRHVSRRRLPSQRRVPPDVHVQLAGGQCAAARRSHRDARPRLRLRHARRLPLLPRRGPRGQHQREVLQLQRADVERVHGAPGLRRVLGAAEPAEASPRRVARRAERRRLVRRRGFLRSTRNLSRGGAPESHQPEHDRDRAVAARRLGLDAGRRAGRHSVRVADRRALSHGRSSSRFSSTT